MFLKALIVSLIACTVYGQGNFSNMSSNAYDPEEILSKIFPSNITQLRGLLKFQDHFDSNSVSFDDQNTRLPNAVPVKFEIDQGSTNLNTDSSEDNGVTHANFVNFGQEIAENGLYNALGNGYQPNNGKKKRRRRKPRQQFPGQPSFGNPGYLRPGYGAVHGSGQGFGPVPGPGQHVGLAYGPGNSFGPNPSEFNEQFHRPPRRPQPSLASDALAAVTGALTSIAHNDDYQCVARLLCEAAAGGALGGSSILDSVSGLQPLLTLLSAYNGISSNPLFVFGRAAFLGMSSKGNSGSCRYAYPLCPTDPEQLVHYLNNHNGGFFRFFNAPQPGQQNLEQFYNQLSQSYGLYQPNPGNNPEFYGLLNSGPYQNPGGQPNLYPNGYGYQQSYGFAYPYNQNYINANGIRFKNDKEFNDNNRSKTRFTTNENRIDKRIQNKPTSFINENSVINNSKWLFPGEDDDDRIESEIGVHNVNSNDFVFTDNRNGKTLKFPDEDFTSNNDNVQSNSNKLINLYRTEAVRTPKAITFPDSQSNTNNYYKKKYYNPTYPNDNNYVLNDVNKGINNIFKGARYSHDNYNDKQEEPGVTTVYVVRGNGDPSKPEIIKLRPGETL